MKCPICKSNEVVNIPSSTMCIDNRTDCFIGTDTKVPKEIMKKHLSIKNICKRCLNEW